MADLWNDSLLDELAVIPRVLLAKAVDKTPSYSGKELVEALLQADNRWKQQYFIAGFPELYSAQVSAQFEKQVYQAYKTKNFEVLAKFRNQRELLQNCRRTGITKIAALLPAPQVYTPESDLNDLLNATAVAISTNEIEDAIEGLLAALEFGVDENSNPLLWAEIQMMLAAYGVVKNQIRGVTQSACEAVVTADLSCGPWLAIKADAYMQLASLASDEDAAIRHHEAAIAAFEALGNENRLVEEYDALGFLHYKRTDGNRMENLETALKCFQAGAKLIDRDAYPANWSAMQFNIGNAFLERETGDPLSNFSQAYEHLTQAAIVQSELPKQPNLAHTLERLELAQVLIYKANLDRDPRSAPLLMALAALQRRDWEGALAAYRSAIAQTESMLAAEYVVEKRREILGDFCTAYSAAAYTCFRLERFDEAITLLEGGRALVLSEELDAFAIDVGQLTPKLQEKLFNAREFLRETRSTKFISSGADFDTHTAEMSHHLNSGAWTELQAVISEIKEVAPGALQKEIDEQRLLELCPEAGALVLPVSSVVGSCVFFIHHGRSAPTVEDLLWIDDFTDNDLFGLIIDWVHSQSADGRSERRQGISSMCERLQVFARDIAQKLKALNVNPSATVVIIPHGGLGMLPLSATPLIPDTGESLLDVYNISFAPSLGLLSLMQQRASTYTDTADSFLGVVDPLGDLDYGRAEGYLVTALFPTDQITVLEGAAANSIKLRLDAVNKKYVHFSCHAYFSNSGGNYAGLHLAHDSLSSSNEYLMAAFEKRQPLEEFFLAGQRWISSMLDLSKCRLVTMSACESIKVDTACPDEFLGLPAAFLRAGAAAIIGTLWRVDDVAAMLLTYKLYQFMINDRQSPAHALRNAQRWLRDATNDTLARQYGEMRDTNDLAFALPKLERELRRHALAAPEERPYSHPYFWAAFVVYGCGP
jgi:CHAT domain-containing protein